MKRILRFAAIGVAGLLALLVVVLAAVYGISEYRFSRSYDVEPAVMALAADEATLARGRHIAITRGCVDCHSEQLDGKTFIDAPPFARLYASNLTRGRGGVGARYTDQDWVRAIRHGVAPDGKPLLFMPAHEFNVLDDEDTGALVSYLKSLPPVDNAPVENSVGPIGRFLFLKGDVPLVPAELIDHDAPRRDGPVEAPTAEYGAYLLTGCTGCHGTNFAGGPIPGTPPGFPAAANLTPDPITGMGKWSEQDFVTALRTGRRPDGRQLAEEMPWRFTAQMTDLELRAMWLHLRSIPPQEYGER